LLAVATSILGLSTIGVLYTPGEENGSGYTAAIALYALTSGTLTLARSLARSID